MRSSDSCREALKESLLEPFSRSAFTLVTVCRKLWITFGGDILYRNNIDTSALGHPYLHKEALLLVRLEQVGRLCQIRPLPAQQLEQVRQVRQELLHRRDDTDDDEIGTLIFDP